MTSPTPQTPTIQLNRLPAILHWRTATRPLVLQAGVIHLWKLTQRAGDAEPQDYRLLSHDEIARAKRMRLAPARYAFVKTRLALRRILGDYLSVAPQDLRFCYGAQGKPALDYPASAIRFNLSHTGDQCLLALSRDTELGIDIEASKPRKQLLRIAERLFSANQYAHLQSLSEPARSQVFFYYWTRLEARIKAQGSGLFEPAKTPSDTFSCRSFIPAPDHLASLATQTACPPIAHWRTYLYREA